LALGPSKEAAGLIFRLSRDGTVEVHDTFVRPETHIVQATSHGQQSKHKGASPAPASKIPKLTLGHHETVGINRMERTVADVGIQVPSLRVLD
jgi:hypothetical protein